MQAFRLFSGYFAVVILAAACSKERATAPAASAAKPSDSNPSPPESENEEPVPGREGDPDDVTAAPTAGSPSGSAGLLAEATHVLDTMTASSYSHKTHVVGSSYDVDCSGFADYLLARVDTAALAELRAATVKRPLAKHFVQFLESGAPKLHWQRVARVADLAPGDLIAWDRPADVTSSNTGHVMIVSAAPELRSPGAWTVPIIDSTGAPHGKRDLRKQAHRTGVGRGVIVLETTDAGAPTAYHWTEIRRSPAHTTTIALGRVL